ncbi:MAG: acylphosphatase [Lachnospiraceae bacterium]|nr:acylphosphatase [Lachnospiraceae bacterium]
MRRSYRFYGDVQGVGFRYRATQAANSLGVTGWVRNETDGTVTMEAQGTEKELRELLRLIQQGRYVEITHMDVEEIGELGGERGFGILNAY